MEDTTFNKISVTDLLKEYEKASKPTKAKPYDLIDSEGKVYVLLKELPYKEFVNKVSLLEKLKNIMGAISPHISSGESLSPEVLEKSLKKKKLEEKLEEMKKEIGMGDHEEKSKETLEEVQQPTEKVEKEEGDMIPPKMPLSTDGKEGISLHPVVKELVKDAIKEEYENIIIEDEETYSKVKEGVGISYIDDHKTPTITSPCPEGDIEKRSEEIVEDIYNNYLASKNFSKTELSKKLVDLTRLFLKAKSKAERNKIRAQIVEIKHTLKSKESRKRIDPFSVLKERQRSNVEKIKDEIKNNYLSALEEAKKEYEEALSLSPSSNLKEKIEELKNQDVIYISSSLSKCISKCMESMIKLHKREVELLGEKIKAKREVVEREMDNIENTYKEAFESLKREIEERIKQEFSNVTISDKTPENNKEIEERDLNTLSNVEMIKKDLESLGDAMWLHYLGKVNRRVFWKYVRGELNKESAVKKAKEFYIKEKAKTLNLNEEEISELMKMI